VPRSACPLDCPDLCSLDVTVEAGRVTRITGDQRSPITDGVICGKVRKFGEHMYGDARVLTPLVRVGGKRDGVLEPTTWDHALDLVTSRLRGIIERSGAEAILPYHYGGSNGWLTEGALASRFFRRLGASTLQRTLCAAATTPATRGLYGAVPGVALEDFVHAQMIVLWGFNPSASGIHLVPIIDQALANGAMLVVIDPRQTPLARRAAIHLPVRPGTDLPVALAVISALFERGYADDEFLTAHATGVAELRARAAPWTITRAAAEAGIDPAALDRFVEMYAAASPAVVRCGWGVERNRNGGSAVAAVLALPTVAGKFAVRGGGYTMANSDVAWTVGPEPAIAAPVPTTRTINMSKLATALATTRDPGLEALFVYNCNPVATAPAQAQIIEQLGRDDLFVVVHEQVLTDTARLADVVLPATTFLEHREVRRGYGAMRLFDSAPVVAPVGQARSNNQLFAELLRRFDLTRPGDPTSDDELVDTIFAASPHGPALRAQLAAHGIATVPASPSPAPLLFIDVAPGTPSGKVELVPAALDAEAPYGLYHYQPDPGSAAYPLALISPAISTQISSTFGQLRTGPASVAIHPDDAAARGVRSGDEVRMWNALGEVRCLAQVTAEVAPGVLSLPKGLWRHHTRNGLTSNALIPETTADLGGQACFNDARVELARA
jgi:anaerobic selenocysteine-containing dehydrogenase